MSIRQMIKDLDKDNFLIGEIKNIDYQAGTMNSKNGIHILFKNGYSLSIQFSPFNYCSNREMLYADIHYLMENNGIELDCENAEIAYGFVGSEDYRSGLLPFENGDIVLGYVEPDEIIKRATEIAKFKFQIEAGCPHCNDNEKVKVLDFYIDKFLCKYCKGRYEGDYT